MTAKDSISANATTTRIQVWDPWVRLAHWALVGAFAVAYVSAEGEGATPDPMHVWAGYVVGGLVVLRVIWGFVGTRHARFCDFAVAPTKALAYLRDLPLGRARRYLGHSPAGGAMVIALLACLAATVVTGLVAYQEKGKGRLANWPPLINVASASSDDREHPIGSQRSAELGENAMSELHGMLANITLGLVILHVLGVALASAAHRENLILAMISGNKRGERPGDRR